jgi:hypothetical protein
MPSLSEDRYIQSAAPLIETQFRKANQTYIASGYADPRTPEAVELTESALQQMKAVRAAFDSLTPPPSIVDMHGMFTGALDLFVTALELRLEGAKELNAGKLFEGNDLYAQAGERLAKITTVLQARG